MFGNPETTTGGRALKFYASVRMDVRRAEALRSGTEIIGNRTKIKIVKNKVAPPFKDVEFDLIYGQGISQSGSLLDMAVEENIIKKSGSWFSYGDERIGQGRDNAKRYLEDNPDLMAEIHDELMSQLEIMRQDDEVEVEDDESALTDEDTDLDLTPDEGNLSDDEDNLSDDDILGLEDM